MIIVCPSCTTKYNVSAGAIGPDGRRVKCAQCGEYWQAYPQEEVPETAVQPDNSDEAASKSNDEYADAFAEVSAGFGGDAENAGGTAPEIEASAVEIDGVADPGFAIEEDFNTLAEPDVNAVGDPMIAGNSQKRIIVKRRKSKPMPVAAMLAVAAFLGAAYVAFEFRNPIVKVVPQLASLYELVGLDVNVRGLEFADLSFRFGAEAGSRVLYVDGKIQNVAGKAITVPAIKLVLVDEAGAEVFAWVKEPSQSLLESGASIPFGTQLPNPPRSAQAVRLLFTTRSSAMLMRDADRNSAMETRIE